MANCPKASANSAGAPPTLITSEGNKAGSGSGKSSPTTQKGSK